MDPSRRSQHSYPLGALLLLMTACGVIAALIAPVVQAVVKGDLGAGETVLSSAGGALAVTVLGGALGLYHHRRLRGCGWGLVTGGIIGGVAGPVVFLPQSSFLAVLLRSIGGAAVLVLIGVAMRLSAERKEPESETETTSEDNSTVLSEPERTSDVMSNGE